MPNFTKFSVWEKEVNEFINATYKNTGLEINKLENWLKEEGLITFIETQTKINAEFESDYKDKHNGVLPIAEITAEVMENNIKAGFAAILPLLINKFAESDGVLREDLNVLYADFVTKAVDNHRTYYPVRAEITREINTIRNENPTLARPQLSSLMTKIFTSKQIQYPDFENDINDQIVLNKEYGIYMQQKAAQSQVNMHTTFQPVATQIPRVHTEENQAQLRKQSL